MDITFELDLSSAALALAGLCGGLIILIEHHAKQHLIDKRRFSSTLGKAALFLFFPFINSIVASIFSTYTYIDKAQVLFMFSALLLIAIGLIILFYILWIAKNAKPDFKDTIPM